MASNPSVSLRPLVGQTSCLLPKRRENSPSGNLFGRDVIESAGLSSSACQRPLDLPCQSLTASVRWTYLDLPDRLPVLICWSFLVVLYPKLRYAHLMLCRALPKNMVRSLDGAGPTSRQPESAGLTSTSQIDCHCSFDGFLLSLTPRPKPWRLCFCP